MLDVFPRWSNRKTSFSHPVAVIRPAPEAVQDAEVVFGQHAAEFRGFPGILAGHALDILAIGVLDICCADVAADRLGGL